jgi:hypothetical protein
MSSPGWANITESAPILKEIVEVLTSKKKKISKKKRAAPAASDEERDYKRMCVSDLRRNLDARGLDVDGSRETLIRRLEEGE